MNLIEYDDLKAAHGKEIAKVSIEDDLRESNYVDGALIIEFTDGSQLHLYDDGRSCCENRWMHSDDPIESFVGALFYTARVEEGPDIDDDGWTTKEVEFLIIITSFGVFTVNTYNEHNGYYGGFSMKSTFIPAEVKPEYSENDRNMIRSVLYLAQQGHQRLVIVSKEDDGDLADAKVHLATAIKILTDKIDGFNQAELRRHLRV